jgi:hypothetical protein
MAARSDDVALIFPDVEGITGTIAPDVQAQVAIMQDRSQRVMDILDYATSDTQRTAVRTGNATLNALWGDMISDFGAQGFRSVRLAGGNYQTDPDTRLINPGVFLSGEPGQTTIYKHGLLSLFQASGTAPAFSGLTLAADVAYGALSITLATGKGASITADTTYVLTDTSPPLPNQNTQKAEFVRVRSVVGDVVNLWGPTKQSFAVASAAQLGTVTLLRGVGYRDLDLVMDITTTIGNSNSYQEAFGLDFAWCHRPAIQRVSLRNGIHAAVCLTGCLNGHIDGLSAYDFGSTTTGSSDPTSVDGPGGYGYGIREEALNQGLVANNLHFERIRHGYTTIGGYPGRNLGVPIGSIIANGVHIDAKNAGWDSHTAGLDIAFNNLHTIGGRFCGFQLRSYRMQMIGCSARDCFGPALWIRGGQAVSTAADECLIQGFSSNNTNTSNDVEVGFDWREYGAILDEGYDTQIEANISRSGGPAITVGRNGVAKRNSYHLKVKDVCQSTATAPVAIDILATNFPAQITIERLLVHSSDAKVTDLIRRSASTISVEINRARGYGYTGRVLNTTSGGSDANVIISNSDGPVIQSRRGPQFIDDFLGRALSTNWLTLKGSDATAAFATTVSGSDGVGRMVTGAGAGATMAVNGTRMEALPAWSAANGGLVAEFRVRISSITSVAVFVGLTAQGNTLTMPFTLASGDVFTAAATDAVGVLFDTSATTQQWCLCGVAGASAQHVFSGVAPVAATYERWRVELTSAGAATFVREGVVVGSVMVGAITASAVISPVACGYSKTATLRNIDLDYVSVEQYM